MNVFRPRFLRTLLWLLLVAATSWNARAQTNAADSFIKAVTASFANWDKDHNQILSVPELDAAIEDTNNKGPAAAALAALKRAARSTNFTLPPLTLENIRQLATSPSATNRPDLRGMFTVGLKRISGVTNHELFASGLPQLNTIRQGRMGDCFCLAPLGAMIHRDPREVASLFSVQNDGRIRVEFGGGAVSIAPLTDAELAMTAANGHDGVWVNLYEKAIAEVRNDERAPEKRADLAIDAIAGGGNEAKIMSYLTGHRSEGSGFKFAKDSSTTPATRATKLDELRQKMTAACREGRLMACGTQKPTTPGITPKHAYAVLNYDSKNDTVELWNPHGQNFTPKGPPGLTHGYATKNGLLTVPLTEFVQQFTGMSFESKFTDISLESVESDDAPNLKVGDMAPKLETGKWLQGEPVKTFSAGNTYLVEFWATWSEPARVAISRLNEINDRYKDKGLVVIGQDCWENDETQVAPFVKTMREKMSYRIALEDKPFLDTGNMTRKWLAAAGRNGIPTAFLVDTTGRIAWIGHPLALKEPLIDDVLAGKFDSQKMAAERARQQEAKELFNQASAFARQGDLAEAEAPLNRLLAVTNDDAEQTAEFLALRANMRARRGRWQDAASDLAQVIQEDPSQYWNWSILTPLLVQAGIISDYRTHCKGMLDHFANTTNPRIAEATAKTCLLLPDALGGDDLALAEGVAENAVALSQPGERMHWRLMTKGLAEYRQGHFTNAIAKMELSQKAIEHEPEAARNMCKADTYFVIAMARQQLQEPGEARTALASGLDIVQKKLPKLNGADLGEVWYDTLQTYILLREAKETVQGVSVARQK